MYYECEENSKSTEIITRFGMPGMLQPKVEESFPSSISINIPSPEEMGDVLAPKKYENISGILHFDR